MKLDKSQGHSKPTDTKLQRLFFDQTGRFSDPQRS